MHLQSPSLTCLIAYFAPLVQLFARGLAREPGHVLLIAERAVGQGALAAEFAQQRIIRDYYAVTGARGAGTQGQAAFALNRHRIEYLAGFRPDPLGGIGNVTISP